ncbi:MAG: hypothetical protein MAG453_01599 [Calditrichaeota bacterium]|nr:hypothetical protein [Calditrichota bacterium]
MNGLLYVALETYLDLSFTAFRTCFGRHTDGGFRMTKYYFLRSKH